MQFAMQRASQRGTSNATQPKKQTAAIMILTSRHVGHLYAHKNASHVANFDTQHMPNPTFHADNSTRKRLRTPPALGNGTLVALFGQLRGGEYTGHSLIKHVLDPNRADLVVLTTNSPILRHHAALRARALHWWAIPEPADWGTLMEAVARELGVFNWRSKTNRSSTAGLAWTSGIAIVFRYMLKQRLVKHGLIAPYSRFVVSRADHVYGCTLDMNSLDLRRYVYIPQGEDYGGVCDRYLICGQQDVLSALSLIEGALLPRNPASPPLPFGPEDFVKRRLQDLGLWPRLRRFPRVMFLARADGDMSATHGSFSARSARRFPPPAGADQTVGYVDEFVMTRWTCGYCKLGTQAPYCCSTRRSVGMALEAAVGAGRLEKVDDSGGCDTSPALQAGLVGVPFLVLGAWTLLQAVRSVRVLRDGRKAVG